ncbi:MAG TPA: transglutaminase-like domain-containing protein [Clostridia bacterium]|nr:transglutaminase-like domain-containing protein [Clostridia bacterium]
MFTTMLAPGVEDESIDLLSAALVIARTVYPAIDIAKYAGCVESLAVRARGIMQDSTESARIIDAVNRVLFQEEGFRGNRTDYYDPRNSYLNEVIDRKLGIPITLSVLYMEVARRVGLPLFGVGMPGHFLLKFYDVDGHHLLIDAFEGGQVIHEGDCQARLDEIYAGQAPLEPEYLHSVGKRQILTRMLNNLKNIYLTSRNFRKALTVVDLILAIYPRSPEDVKQRALLRYNLGQLKGSANDFEDYLKMSPDASDVDDVRQLALSIRRTMASFN